MLLLSPFNAIKVVLSSLPPWQQGTLSRRNSNIFPAWLLLKLYQISFSKELRWWILCSAVSLGRLKHWAKVRSTSSVTAKLQVSNQKFRSPSRRDKSIPLWLLGGTEGPVTSSLSGFVTSLPSLGKVASGLGLQSPSQGTQLCYVITELCSLHKGSLVLWCGKKRGHKLFSSRLFKFFLSLSRSTFLKWSWSSCTV